MWLKDGWHPQLCRGGAGEEGGGGVRGRGEREEEGGEEEGENGEDGKEEEEESRKGRGDPTVEVFILSGHEATSP